MSSSVVEDPAQWLSSVIQPYLSSGTNVHAHLIHYSLGSSHSPVTIPNGNLIGSAFMVHVTFSLYITFCVSPFTPKIWPLPWRGGDEPQHRFLVTRPNAPNIISTESNVIQNSRSLTMDGQTERRLNLTCKNS